MKEGGRIPPEYDPYLGEFMRLQNPWMAEEVKIPCWSISTKCYVMPNGDVYLCQQKSVVLGNLYEQTLGEIWRSSDTIATHERYRSCNDCWLACNRPFDTELAAASSTVLPTAVLNRLVGHYSWDLIDAAYNGRSSKPVAPVTSKEDVELVSLASPAAPVSAEVGSTSGKSAR